MATKQMVRLGRPTKKRSRIPLFEYLKFKLSKDKSETHALNTQIIGKEMAKETSTAERLEKNGELHTNNGLGLFLEACRRRLENPKWHHVFEHSDNVRRYAHGIAETWEKQKERSGMPKDDVLLDVIAKVSGYHDIGKTLIAPYLINREEGTWFGIGKGKRIDFKKELEVLRLSHVEAGTQLLSLYRRFMSDEEFTAAKWIIGGHHLAYDGKGTASAPSYPSAIDGIPTGHYVGNGGLPEVVRIMRTADVYSAIMENRFYLAESERVVTKVTGMKADDAALGLLITVAGTDVDPEMVKCLMIGKYNVKSEIAKTVVADLACREPERLRERGGDIRFSLEQVIPQKMFLEIIGVNAMPDCAAMPA